MEDEKGGKKPFLSSTWPKGSTEEQQSKPAVEPVPETMEVDNGMPESVFMRKRKVVVIVTFLKLGEINTLKEQFEADVLVQAKWRDMTFDGYYHDKSKEPLDWSRYWNPKLFIENALGDPKVTSSCQIVHEDGEAWVHERKRIRGVFMETMELFEFPFDVQDLSVTIMSDMPSTEAEIVEDKTEIHKIYKQSFIDEQEWYLYKYVEAELKELAKDKADPTVRRCTITARTKAARRPAYFVFNIFSVTSMIATLSFVTFAVDPSKIENRLQLTYTLVLTSVAFKFVANQTVPKISYLTYLDRYILATMVVLGGICLWHGIQHHIPDDHQDNDYIALIVFLGVYLIYNIQFFVRIYLVPYRKRRDMAQKEHEYIKVVGAQATIRNTIKKGRMDSDSETENKETTPLTAIHTQK